MDLKLSVVFHGIVNSFIHQLATNVLYNSDVRLLVIVYVTVEHL